MRNTILIFALMLETACVSTENAVAVLDEIEKSTTQSASLLKELKKKDQSASKLVNESLANQYDEAEAILAKTYWQGLADIEETNSRVADGLFISYDEMKAESVSKVDEDDKVKAFEAKVLAAEKDAKRMKDKVAAIEVPDTELQRQADRAAAVYFSELVGLNERKEELVKKFMDGIDKVYADGKQKLADEIEGKRKSHKKLYETEVAKLNKSKKQIASMNIDSTETYTQLISLIEEQTRALKEVSRYIRTANGFNYEGLFGSFKDALIDGTKQAVTNTSKEVTTSSDLKNASKDFFASLLSEAQSELESSKNSAKKALEGVLTLANSQFKVEENQFKGRLEGLGLIEAK
jgi:hypothetical protein